MIRIHSKFRNPFTKVWVAILLFFLPSSGAFAAEKVPRDELRGVVVEGSLSRSRGHTPAVTWDELRGRVISDAPVTSDVGPAAIQTEILSLQLTSISPEPLVEAYVTMAVEAHDRYRDLDAAHDWLDKALELDPDNYVAKGILDRVKAEEQQAGAQRAGAFMGAVQHMLAEQARREQAQREHEEYKERHPEGEHHPGEEWHPPPEEVH